VIDRSLTLLFRRYVPVHIEYILTEVLKNAFRATVEQYAAIRGSKTITPSSASELPPVTITISPSDKFLSLRVRDEGGGVPPVNVENVFSYAFTTAGRNRTDFEDEGMGGGPYAAQHVGGSAALGLGIGAGGAGDGNLFGEIIGRGLQTGLGTIAGLGYG
jgi:signal transduction histidine kinase